jgi:hypothetical protein
LWWQGISWRFPPFFIDPGAEIEISFDRLGSLRCHFAEPARKLLPSRWPLRSALQKFHGQ